LDDALKYLTIVVAFLEVSSNFGDDLRTSATQRFA
jgi:hypothetical protein